MKSLDAAAIYKGMKDEREKQERVFGHVAREVRKASKAAPVARHKSANPRMMEVLRFIERYIETNEVAPCIREIGDACKITSTSVTNYYIAQLVEMGFVERVPRISRGMRVTAKGREALHIPTKLIVCPHCGGAFHPHDAERIPLDLGTTSRKRIPVSSPA